MHRPGFFSSGQILVGSDTSLRVRALKQGTHSGSRHTGVAVLSLQSQVCQLYQQLARRLGRHDVEPLMDDTLASNFCPFRSPSWDALPHRELSIAFAQELWLDVWRHVLRHVERPVVICNGKRAPDHFRTVLEGEGARLVERPEVGRTGWGEQTYSLEKYDTAMLVTVPHLSRYPIVGRPESQHAVDRIISAVAGAIRG